MKVDVKLLFALWHDKSIKERELAARLGVSQLAIRRLKYRYGLPNRCYVGKSRENDIESPSPEEIEERKAAIQASWTPEERRSRMVQKTQKRWTPPSFVFDGRNATFSG
jgi:hypothetical protein